jgi:hypothetical protein
MGDKNINYDRNYESDTSNLEIGKPVGKVKYMLSGNACSDYKMQNGDATLLPKGTKIYEIKSYSADGEPFASFVVEAK